MSEAIPRFIVGHGTPNAEVLKEARMFFRELDSSEIPFVGVTAFGSRTKGYATEQSDLDLNIFVDMGDRAHRTISNNLGVWQPFLYEDERKPLDSYGEVNAIRNKSELEFLSKFVLDERRFRIPSTHHLIVPVTEAYLQDCARFYIDDKPGYRPEAPVRLFNASLHNPVELRRFRAAFIKPMLQYGEPGRGAWRRFVGDLRVFEDSDKHPRDVDSVRYPETPEDAARVYAKFLLEGLSATT